MIKTITRPSTAHCSLPMYIGFLLSEPNGVSCCRLGSLLHMSHDSVNGPQDVFNEVKPGINLQGGTLSVDDSVLDKPYAHYIALVGHYWSGKHHAVVKGANLITLYYTDPQGHHQPVNFRVYDKADKKTKNDYFLDMLAEVLSLGLEPAFVTGDSWYSCVKNLKTIKNHQLGFLFALEANRLVSVEKGTWVQVQSLEVPNDGLVVWLREFGQVKLFRTSLKNQVRRYIIHLPEVNDPNDSGLKFNMFDQTQFEALHDCHWQTEQYHRAIKQVCHIESFQVREKVAVKNHIFAAICEYVKLRHMRAMDVIKNCYQLQRNLFNEVIAVFINTFAPSMHHMNPQFLSGVNA